MTHLKSSKKLESHENEASNRLRWSAAKFSTPQSVGKGHGNDGTFRGLGGNAGYLEQ